MNHPRTLLTCLLLSATLGAQTSSFSVEAGPLSLQVHTSETATVFHLVDQVAEWSPYCHKQYGRWIRGKGAGLSSEDEALLAQHAAIRKKKGWGGGLEQTFYTVAGLDDAIAAGIDAGFLTEEEATVEREVLSRFAERARALLDEQAQVLASFRARIEDRTEAIEPIAEKLSRFCEGARPRVPVFLIANPHPRDFGGGFNGGRMTVEVPAEYDAWPTFLHEVLHAFVATRRELVESAAAEISDLDYETLNEGIAYALAPGLVRPDGRDALAERVARDFEDQKTLEDPYVRFNRFGLALRPALARALDDPQGTLKTFLSTATGVWQALGELERVRAPSADSVDYANDSTPSFFAMCSRDWEAVRDRLGWWSGHFFGRRHTASEYAEMLGYAKPGDVFLIALAVESGERVPGGFEDLLPKPWPEIEAQLVQEGTVELSGRGRGLDVRVLVARRPDDLRELVRVAELLAR